MTSRFIRYAGEAVAGEYVDLPCQECGELSCDCDDAYHDPDALRRWMALSRDEQQARVAAAHARIAEAFAGKVERDLRFTLEMQKRGAA